MTTAHDFSPSLSNAAAGTVGRPAACCSSPRSSAGGDAWEPPAGPDGATLPGVSKELDDGDGLYDPAADPDGAGDGEGEGEGEGEGSGAGAS